MDLLRVAVFDEPSMKRRDTEGVVVYDGPSIKGRAVAGMAAEVAEVYIDPTSAAAPLLADLTAGLTLTSHAAEVYVDSAAAPFASVLATAPFAAAEALYYYAAVPLAAALAALAGLGLIADPALAGLSLIAGAAGAARNLLDRRRLDGRRLLVAAAGRSLGYKVPDVAPAMAIAAAANPIAIL
jgi:hypothetical protein